MKKLTGVLTTIFVLLASAATVFASDTPSDWAVAEVQAATDAGFVQEALQGDYTAPITRQEFAELAMRFAMYELGYDSIEEFSDLLTAVSGPASFVDTDDVYVLLAAQMSVVKGDYNGFFDSDRSITREEAAAMLSRLYDSYSRTQGLNGIAFEDHGVIADWALQHVRWCVTTGVMKGVSATHFDPKGTYTREQSIVTFARMDAIEGWEEQNKTAKIRRKITTEDAIAEFLDNGPITLLDRYETGGYGTVLYVNHQSAAERYYFVLIGNDGAAHSFGRLPILNRWGGTPPVTKVELLDYNSVLYFEARYEAAMLGPDSDVSEPGTYWERVNLMTLTSERGYIKDNG